MIGPIVTLAATDADDLETISARLQDAVARVADFAWLPKTQRFAGLFNRYRWEEDGRAPGSRVRSGLHFDNVLSARASEIDRTNPEAVVSLLAIRFQPRGPVDPAGTIELLFAGGATLRLEVECISAELTDLAGEWPARARPAHQIDET
ncbi:MAG TPA: DUF2948 family protein [Rhizomicrobium sp.]|jgi:hypothetical protein